MDPSCVDEFPPGVKFGVVGFRPERTCRAFLNNGACSNVLKDDPAKTGLSRFAVKLVTNVCNKCDSSKV